MCSIRWSKIERKKESKWTRIGYCHMCGDCCRMETLPARIKAYEDAGIPFQAIEEECPLFDKVRGVCKDYGNRPVRCKTFPLHPIDIVALPRCGFYFIERKKDSTLEEINEYCRLTSY